MKATLSGVNPSKEASGQVYVFGNQEKYLLTTLTEQKEIKFQTRKHKKKSPESDSYPGAKGKSPNGSFQVENPKTVNTELHPCGCKPTSMTFVNWYDQRLRIR